LHLSAVCVTNDPNALQAPEIFMSDSRGFRTHHKYLIAAIGVIAVLAFLYNLGVFDIWSVDQVAK
jgi:hypothetical protein